MTYDVPVGLTCRRRCDICLSVAFSRGEGGRGRGGGHVIADRSCGHVR